MTKNHQTIEIKELPQSEIEIKASIDAPTLEKAFEKALITESKEIEIPGFRKGKVPKEMLLSQFGESFFLEKASNNALSSVYPLIIEENKISPIGHPKVVITKLEKGNPLEFTITVAVVPKISLPNYKKIAKEIMSEKVEESVTDEEVEKMLLEIRKHHAHMEMHKSGAWTDHNHPEVNESDLPEITDELVKKFGNFENLADMKDKLKENLVQEKTVRSKEKRRMDVVEKIINETTIEMPLILVDNELDTMLAQFEGDIMRAGGTMEDYLKTIGKSIEEIRKDWNDTAIKKAKAQLVISKIAAEEKILADKEHVRAESEKILTLYPDADPVRARSYVAMMLSNEKVFEFFESQK